MKIRRQTLLVSIISVSCVCAVAFSVIAYMRSSIVSSSERLGLSAAADSMTSLELQMEESLLSLARSKAAMSDEKLLSVSELVNMISEHATNIMSSPENYGDSEVQFPDPANEGVLVSQLRLGDDVKLEDVEAEALLLGNIHDLLEVIHNNSAEVRSVYIGSESGISISADRDSHQKTNVFEPRQRPWYTGAKEKNAIIWTDVISDVTGRGLGITCAKPYYGAGGEIRGVAGIGMLLENIQEIVVGTRVGKTGYAFIANERGEIIISDMLKADADGNVIRINLLEDGMIPLDTVNRMMAGGSNIERVTIDGTDCFIAYESLSALPWCLAIVIDVNEIISPALESQRNIIEMKDAAVGAIDRIILIVTVIFIIVLTVTVCGNIALSKKLAGKLASPIIALSKGAEIIGAGDLDYKLDVKTGDEIESLSDTFNAMISGIKRITAEKERIGAELSVATQIQAGMLPCIFPPYPGQKGFELYATMLPAKEVGGDFYDFFMIGENKIATVMADVSGKGVPAALFMVITKTLIKNNALAGKSPGEVFETVNDMLCENNEAGMFVTMFMGYLEVDSGRFVYVNAGHNYPFVKKADGDFELLKSKPTFVLAGMEGMRYEESEITLGPGDALYMYTDGVTEAVNEDLQLFSDERLLCALNKYKDCHPKELLPMIKKEIDIFVGGAEQADDITMLGLKIDAVDDEL